MHSSLDELDASSGVMGEQRVNDDGLAYCQVGVPHELREAVERHHQHMTVLAEQLRQVGLAESAATAYIDVAMDSYRQALVQASARLRNYSE